MSGFAIDGPRAARPQAGLRPGLELGLGSGLLPGVLPGLLVAFFAFSAGGFDAPMRPWSVLAGHAALTLFAVLGARAGLDPLGLGRRWWLLATGGALVVGIGLGRASSPGVGFEAVPVLVLSLFAMRGIARCWRPQWTSWSLVLALSAVSLTALISVATDGRPAAMPIGHHNLLGAWIVSLLPFVVLDAEGRWRRLVGALTALLAFSALALTGSTGAAIALGGAMVVGGAIVVGHSAARAGSAPGMRRPGTRGPGARAMLALVALAAVIVIGVALPRLDRMARGDDPSATVRLGYLESAIDGIANRPWFGHGANGSRLRLAETMRPVPGVHPAGEVVADPHSLPLTLAFDYGIVGFLLVLAVAGLAFRRSGDRAPQRGDAGHRAPVMAMAASAFVVASLFGRPLAASALGVAALVIIGGRLAAQKPLRAPLRAGGKPRFLATLVVLASALALVPIDLGRVAYHRAVFADDASDRRAWLHRAIRLDPWQPLYRARLGALVGDAELLDAAAKSAAGVASLWLAAANHADDDRPFLLKACALDPLAAMAPMLLAESVPEDPRAAGWAARALIAEPRLLGAVSWRSNRRLRAAAVGAIVESEGIDPGWREAFEELARRADGAVEGNVDDEIAALSTWADRDPATSMSLHSFRRTPWPWRLASIEVDVSVASAIDLPSAASLDTTARYVFEGEDCGLGYAPALHRGNRP